MDWLFLSAWITPIVTIVLFLWVRRDNNRDRRFEILMDDMHQRFTSSNEFMDQRFENAKDQVNSKFYDMEQRTNAKFNHLEERINARFDHIEKRMDKVELHLHDISDRISWIEGVVSYQGVTVEVPRPATQRRRRRSIEQKD